MRIGIIYEMTWDDQALAALRAAGLRRGGARRAVVDFLAAQDCCRSAQEIHDGIVSRGGAVGVASV
jgi:Fe2+ or Zn2+ uptake regulation protein